MQLEIAGDKQMASPSPARFGQLNMGEDSPFAPRNRYFQQRHEGQQMDAQPQHGQVQLLKPVPAQQAERGSPPASPQRSSQAQNTFAFSPPPQRSLQREAGAVLQKSESVSTAIAQSESGTAGALEASDAQSCESAYRWVVVWGFTSEREMHAVLTELQNEVDDVEVHTRESDRSNFMYVQFASAHSAGRAIERFHGALQWLIYNQVVTFKSLLMMIIEKLCFVAYTHATLSL